uniref:Uncharacterized protein n=1 Tax=Euplotes harpa TaxID=151035 RepID=A0A7S3J127_9SPIT|mmetsp:Transcript_13692/g.15884  ORF Transcript_13692/g.15884 Transcript_13692/m.15884 type:complete len:124 (+) Transcript_13692:3-374(+)
MIQTDDGKHVTIALKPSFSFKIKRTKANQFKLKILAKEFKQHIIDEKKRKENSGFFIKRAKKNFRRKITSLSPRGITRNQIVTPLKIDSAMSDSRNMTSILSPLNKNDLDKLNIEQEHYKTVK